MSDLSASHANTTEKVTGKQFGYSESEALKPPKVKIWDAPTRIVHWLMAFSFAGAYITAESERWRLAHVTLGYTMAGLIVFRLIWGVIGSRYARFSEFTRGPRAIISYLGGLFRGKPKHFTGHNPAGAIAILLLLGLGAALAASGYPIYNDLGGEWLEEAHELLANFMLGVVIIHILAVLISSQLHHENLPLAMINGNKRRPLDEAIPQTWRSVAIVILLAVAGFWWWQWQSVPVNVPLTIVQAGLDKPKVNEKDNDD